ncbi:hypothetical protein BC834DRAFT_284134 [Gloeopeniophorella convolvens]|nr:hypothetical protein BC834DRAFT_284134 [Gloeopeniophorella convolvens]
MSPLKFMRPWGIHPRRDGSRWEIEESPGLLSPQLPGSVKRRRISYSQAGGLRCIPRTIIWALNDDVLLVIFELYLTAHSTGKAIIQQRRWYALVHVCRRWRILVLSSASRLNLCLYLTNRSIMTDILEYSPPFPLELDYSGSNIGRKAHEADHEADHGRLLLLLQSHANRLRSIKLHSLSSASHKFVVAMDTSYPILRQLHLITSQPSSAGHNLVLPAKFLAPNLREVSLSGVLPPPLVVSTASTSTPNLVTLHLDNIQEHSSLPPNRLSQWIMSTPRLEDLSITFCSPFYRILGEEDSPLMSITIPRLRSMRFKGSRAYLEDILTRIHTPVLRQLWIMLFNQPTFHLPCLSEFVSRTGSLRYVQGARGR